MNWEAWATLSVVAVMAVGLMANLAGPDLILLAAVAALVALGIIDAGSAVAGFGNEGLITVGVLFVLVAGLTQTGAMELITSRLLGRPRSLLGAQARLMIPIAGMSAFLNNTPLVAMFMPVVDDWCKKFSLSPSKLYIPLSYAAILGGTCTLIGTSTNLVVYGLLKADLASTDPAQPIGLRDIGFFELAWVGVPCALVGIGYCLLLSRWLLPDRKPALHGLDDPRQYTVEMLVEPTSPLVGKTIEQAGLRQLPGLYLVEVTRAPDRRDTESPPGDDPTDGHENQEGETIVAVGPEVRLHAGDRLVFVGVVESVVDLRKMRGLVPATDQVFKLDGNKTHRTLVEAVVGSSNQLNGRTIREGRFRSIYGAAVIAVGRGGERIRKKIGDIVLQPGDTLLLEATPAFVERQRNRRDFFLVSQVQNSAPPRHERAWLALAILIALVLSVTAGLASMLAAALVAAAIMIATRCCTGAEARQSVDWSILVVIGAALGVAHALDTSGAAGHVADAIVSAGQSLARAYFPAGSALIVLAAVYLATMLFTAFVTNAAAVALIYPIAKAASLGVDANFLPFLFAIMFAASNDFATPIGYQTNLMVYGPGGYRFSDYVRFGGPLNLLMFTLFMLIAPQVWDL